MIEPLLLSVHLYEISNSFRYVARYYRWNDFSSCCTFEARSQRARARTSKYHLDRTDPDHSSHDDANKSVVADLSQTFVNYIDDVSSPLILFRIFPSFFF